MTFIEYCQFYWQHQIANKIFLYQPVILFTDKPDIQDSNGSDLTQLASKTEFYDNLPFRGYRHPPAQVKI